ncbi:unnamed protein product [Kluyveromyces dobzhanskii CBS 2104]|uniref:WGS project CCBQ000000000 data, contig 00106 n=1 Tax=Kluyveromyces dobzhanskii CBS 2104 TaxID=1427455 RepID=A0A0A8L7X9_9SACH|nr:unnamed protein product [Kluyveromyces dobzhanskii CBS 2104]
MTEYREESIKQLPRVTATETSNTLFTIERLNSHSDECDDCDDGDNGDEGDVPRLLVADRDDDASSMDADDSDLDRKHRSRHKRSSSPANHVVIGGKTYMTSDLEEWLARDHDLENQNELSRAKTNVTLLQGELADLDADHKIYANPLPLGLSSFGFSCLLLSMVNAQVRGVTNNKIVLGAAIFYGGLIELIAGLFCFPLGDTFGMTVLGAYGGFWLSYAVILTDQFNVVSSYSEDPAMLKNALGLYLSCWAVFTTLCWLCTMKSTWGLFMCFSFLEVTFILLACGEFLDSVPATKAGGYFGMFSALCAFYVLYSGLASTDNSYVPLKQFSMPKTKRAAMAASRD